MTTVKTEHEINDIVWFIYNGKILSGRIKNIKVEIVGTEICKHDNKRGLLRTGEYKIKGYRNSYYIDSTQNSSIYKSEFDIFKTKEDLLISISKQ